MVAEEVSVVYLLLKGDVFLWRYVLGVVFVMALFLRKILLLNVLMLTIALLFLFVVFFLVSLRLMGVFFDGFLIVRSLLEEGIEWII